MADAFIILVGLVILVGGSGLAAWMTNGGTFSNEPRRFTVEENNERTDWLGSERRRLNAEAEHDEAAARAALKRAERNDIDTFIKTHLKG